MIRTNSARKTSVDRVEEWRNTYSVGHRFAFWFLVSWLCFPLASHAQERFVDTASEETESSRAVAVFREHCFDCHSIDAAEGGFGVNTEAIDWDDHQTQHDWESALQFLTKGVMPPADSDQLSVVDRATLRAWIEQNLTQHQPIGGTSLRRLSAREYTNTIRSVFDLGSFTLPHGFPPDQTAHGFDNQSAALVVAPSHLEAFADAAGNVADELFPEPKATVASQNLLVPADKLVVSYSSACLIDGSMRLASSGSVPQRNATWPSSFEAPASGSYKVRVDAFASVPADLPTPILTVSRGQSAQSPLTTLAELPISAASAGSREIVVEMDRGDTLFLMYSNGPFVYEDKVDFRKFMEALFDREPELANSWAQVGVVPRGGAGWERLKTALASGDVPQASVKDLEKTLNKIASNPVSSGETLVYKYFEQGPYIGIRSVRIEGPTEQRPEPEDLRIVRQRRRLLAGSELSDDSVALDPEKLRHLIQRLLERSFRRPLRASEVDAYLALIQRETESTGSSFKGLHLAIRTMLLSPSFLYRDLQRDPADDRYLSQRELANRLSYFLTSGPPDAALVRSANRRELADQRQLAKQVQRILSDEFICDFVNQWLGIDAVDALMPDTRLIRKFAPAHRSGMKDEVAQTFRHVLRNNLPIRELVAPNYVFTNRSVATDLYEMDKTLIKESFPSKGKQADSIKQIPVAPDGWRGGLLSMPAVMMATANGVDTQPVLRGVWVLDNILGSPSPDPPDAVPALTPDTGGAASPKARLAAHMDSQSCAVCHREIDPLGFVLENFDAIGRWRDHYVSYSENATGRAKPVKGLTVDATGTLPDGTPLDDIVDFKQWLAADPLPLAQCLSEKLLTYATGRSLNYRQRRQIAEIVAQHAANDYKLNDLLVALVQSEVFRAK